MRKRILIIIGVFISILIAFCVIGYSLILAPYYDNQVKIVDKPNTKQDVPSEDIIIDDEIISSNIQEFTFNDSSIKDNNNSSINEYIDSLESSLDPVSKIEPLDNPYIEWIYKEEAKSEDIINILLTGMDARGSETKSRSDTIILCSYNKVDNSVKLTSFMRDTWVNISNKGWGRINSATAYGGIGMLINTINDNFDLDVQNYVQIRFDDFAEVIDILGGIDIELTQSEINYINNKQHSDDKNWNNDITQEPGLVHLNGRQALWHCRNRTIGNADFARTSRQRDVLTVLVEKARNMSVMQATELVYKMKDYVDMNIPISTIIDLAKNLILSDSDVSVETFNIPIDGLFNYANKNGASVIEINLDETKNKLHDFLGYENNI